MSIRLLRTLVAVSEVKTFTAAAEVVHVTHAAVSQQMRTLEADLGVELFDRSKRTPELTPLGHQIVAKARSVVAAYDDLLPSVLADNGLRGVINFGAIPSTLTGLTPQAMSVLKARYPEVGLHIRPGLTQHLIVEVERGALDAAIVSRPHLMPAGLIFRPLAEEPMQLIAAACETENDPIELLQTRPFIRFNRNAVVGTLIDNWIRSRNLRVTETMELNSPEAITSMVEQDLGVSIVPDLAVKPSGDDFVRRIALGPDRPVRTLGLVHQDSPIKAEAMDALFDALSHVISRTGSTLASDHLV
ncbi:LysR substrate-binding domain-containing protein [Yoonia sp. R2331]|uniref:LysR substrate-binding domain-containing protein n=1 Tax=Yoonia sp. R2331 TaxID=3237238 RepID=UPI0034E50934